MTRFACVWLPQWPIERHLRDSRKNAPEASGAQGPAGPFALAASQAGGFRLTAVNGAAGKLGLVPGELLADARARVPTLRVRDADPRADRQRLVQLARWCSRFSPSVAPWPENEAAPEHGLTLDITGCAHLFGGEDSMAAAILSALKLLGLKARLAFADTIGAAYALARHGEQRLVIVPPDGQGKAIADLPVKALRITGDAAASLHRLGLKRIGLIAGLPRAALTARFGAELVRRLEQALGSAPEPLSPLIPHAPYRVSAVLAEPILAQEHVQALVHRLAADLAPILERDGKGARTIRLTLFRVDGETAELTIRLADAARDPAHIENLFGLKLDTLVQDFDAGFGYEAARLDVLTADVVQLAQSELGSARSEARAHLLIDRLGSRLGVENVLRLEPRQSHLPERAVVAHAAAHHPDTNWQDAIVLTRPLLMLPSVEPLEVVALLPEGPPRQFRWRGVLYGVAASEGPERIRPEWWRGGELGRERDYYVVEDEEGRRFWLYRDGAYGETVQPHWFMHGVFA
jgi:protein ImuB